MRLTIVSALALCMLTHPAIAQVDQTGSGLSKADYERIVESPDDEALFQQFLKKLPTITLGTQPQRTYYILEGDLLLTEQQVHASIRNYSDAPRPALSSGELKVMMAGGKPVFWARDQRRLTYAVSRATFRSKAEYDLVVGNMKSAAKAWSDVCADCQLQYIHKEELDANPSSGHVTFIVTFSPNQTRFVAASFFPNDPLDRRILIIAPSYFTTKVDKVGILRHELGHINGYRHEHIAGIPGCSSEDGNWKPLTDYDRLSVMHYFCGGGGTLDLLLSDSDKRGHRQLYGLQ
jgi:hypothetical protein